MEPYESKWAASTDRSFEMGSGPRLVPLSDTTRYEVADNEPDIRGWDVVGADGEKIGEVDDLIVDPEAMKVRYVVVDAVSDLESNGRKRNMLIPIGVVQLDTKEDEVEVENITKKQLESCPPYSGCPITKEFAHKVQAHYLNLDPGTANPSPGTDYSDFYEHPLYNPEKYMKGRRG